MTPDYERAKYAADRLSAACDLQTLSPSKYYADRAKLHLTSAAAAMGFVLAPMMPDQPAPDDLRAAYDREVLE